ncbi:glycine/sarcosine/betaine reductase complex component C subunit beta [Falseniella ignava]|uniref:DUF5940 domain-containing protein n=2 Tax=Falseniella ignava TaxID=137730 RepID=K1LGF0_9LACT|nr:glycine/sarcosine/betaine reductase complex component C subunit beta [Falseniella ignava]EKB53696.1 hypothetical protein HMPREF9707_01449 [Falseniella ignava CCUG 37419]PKY88680.1 glycine reductase [Falseniella ignava]
MNYSVLKAASYILAHTPDMVGEGGTTISTERVTAPDSEYLKTYEKYLRRDFNDIVNYAPNQTYIGNYHYKELSELPEPWHENLLENQSRFSDTGEIMPQMEFYALLSIVDVFDLVFLEEEFAEKAKAELAKHELFKDRVDEVDQVHDLEWIKKHIEEVEATPLYHEGEVVGCVLRAHEVDPNLTSHIIMENLVCKASGVLAALNLLKQEGINAEDIDYVIECSEEAIGDMNQRGGGNMAKSIAEICHIKNATGSDLRGFCAAPTHTLLAAASHVSAGTFKNVLVVSGGSTAKLGMNGKSHVGKDMPILEDCVAGLAFLVSENDGVHPVIRHDVTGRHVVNSGSSPQHVTQALVADALAKEDLKVQDVDVYASELQNPNITVPAGAGNVPLANLKIIGAIGVVRKDLERTELPEFINSKSVPGWAPTQGHIPSGVPYLGYALHDLVEGDLNRAMIIGKGSLFLGRMTNLFDGVSVMIERNSDKFASTGVDSDLKETVKTEVAAALRDFAANFSTED